MQKEKCEEWMSIDEDIPVPATLTDLEICQAIKVDDSDGDECVEENPPTDAEMRQALDILKRGVQHRSTNFKKQYKLATQTDNNSLVITVTALSDLETQTVSNTNNDSNSTFDSAQLTGFSARTANETPKSFQSINTLLYTARRLSLQAGTADKTPKRDSKRFRTPRRSQLINTLKVDQH
ncbi:hypothetical protein AVEN_2764-1 [Araneus ventricosus]|uniref:Uncharacterized protein n=1 Tax=Araneus ventricosus TaxID=182803 RepID=A0A4Y2I0C0_ARAVE|nr:hypothetical protein AVEN_2764-1 [Araneus ventricosus]